MPRKIQGLLVLAFAIGGILCLAACGGGGSTTTATINSVAITPTSVNVPINEQAEFTAVVTLSNTTIVTTTAVTWEVNGIAGGNASIGTIVPSPVDNQVGIYTAPGIVPTTNNGEVDITAVAQQTVASNNTTVTSNTAIVTITVGQGLTVIPSAPAAPVPAGGSFKFTALLNGLVDANATWTVSSPSGGNVGSIDASGVYTAPPYPPPGDTVTITATDTKSVANQTLTATATATDAYSDHSLSGPFAFSYTGNDENGLLNEAGSFITDGNGDIESGVLDRSSFLAGITTQVSITGGNYVVGPDGRCTATVNSADGTETWRFVLTTNQHASLVRFDTHANGSGTVDAQSVSDLANSDSTISGFYVIRASGLDSKFNPVGLAGVFDSDGGGNIGNQPNSTFLVTTFITPPGEGSAGGGAAFSTYNFDPAFPGTGRGLLDFSSAGSINMPEFAFYSFGGGTHMHVIEIDSTGYRLAGEVYAGLGPAPNLAAANYIFTESGNSSSGGFTTPYAAGGVFASNGAGKITGGVFDSNNAGTVTLNTSITSGSYIVPGAEAGLADTSLSLNGGGSIQLDIFQTSLPPPEPSAVMIDLDISSVIATGLAYQQTTTNALGAGSFALDLAGAGEFHDSPASYPQDLTGEMTLSFTGNLDINNFSAVFPADPLTATGSSIAAPNGTTGRGTASPASTAPLIISATDPNATYDLVYYTIDPNTALLLDQDKSLILTGLLARQF